MQKERKPPERAGAEERAWKHNTTPYRHCFITHAAGGGGAAVPDDLYKCISCCSSIQSSQLLRTFAGPASQLRSSVTIVEEQGVQLLTDWPCAHHASLIGVPASRANKTVPYYGGGGASQTNRPITVSYRRVDNNDVMDDGRSSFRRSSCIGY